MMTNYLDEDMAYILGMLTARGTITTQGKIATIMVKFPFKNLEVVGISRSYKSKQGLALALDKILTRVSAFGVEVTKNVLEYHCELTIETKKNSLFMRNLRLFFKDKRSYLEFHLPQQILKGRKSVQKEFVRGYADVAGSVRTFNKYIDGRHRVYLDILNKNWHLPVELCDLLQNYLQIPVQSISWGHPNIRDGQLTFYKKGKRGAWAKEHQLRVFAEYFLPIGFYITYKQKILKEFADFNKKNFSSKPTFCAPPKRIGKKPHHPEEILSILPPPLRKHFDALWQICEIMGCKRCKLQKKIP